MLYCQRRWLMDVTSGTAGAGTCQNIILPEGLRKGYYCMQHREQLQMLPKAAIPK